MKTLVLSLLRLGDFFQQVPLLHSLQGRGQDVHVLVNENLKILESLFPEFKFHFFPREALQRTLTDSKSNLIHAVSSMDLFLSELNQNQFDRIENWTHNFLAAHLIDLIGAKEKVGAQFQDGELLRASKGLRYLNETWGQTTKASFHWVDALALAMGHKLTSIPQAQVRESGPIFLQVLTSDSKKNWSLAKWKELAHQLTEVGEDVRLLCAPFEKDQLLKAGFSQKVQVLDLIDLKKELSTAKLLITGDTSVAHLAVLTKTPVLALFLGSADPRKTAPRLKGAQILWTAVECSPCRHRDPCSQLTHECGDKLSVETVYKEVMKMQTQAIEVFEGPNLAAVIGLPQSTHMIGWSQMVWNFYLNGDHEQRVAPYGSAARLLLQNWGSSRRVQPFVESMKERIEKSSFILENLSEVLWGSLREFNEKSQINAESEMNLKTQVARLHALWRETDFITRLTESVQSSDASPFVRLRIRKEAFREVHEIFNVQKNLIRVLEQEIKERGVLYGARA